jgi:hypothetical protein
MMRDGTWKAIIPSIRNTIKNIAKLIAKNGI